MVKYAVVCLECATTTTGPKHKKLCNECRLLKDIEFWYDRAGTCKKDAGGCGDKFTPVRRGESVCGKCAPGRSDNIGSCGLCGKAEAYRYTKEIAVCERCARDPAMRIKFIGGLRKRQRARRAETGWKSPAVPAHV